MTNLTQWEYRVVSVGSSWLGTKDEVIEAKLNELGLEGWEVFSTHIPENGGQVRLIAKRLLDPSARRRREWDGT